MSLWPRDIDTMCQSFFHLFICTRMTQILFFYCQLFLRDAPNLLVLSSPCTFSYPRLSCFQYLSHYKSPHTSFIILYFFRRVVSFLSWFSICFHISSTTLLSIGHLSFLPPKHSPFLHLSASTSAPAQTPPWRTKEQIVFVAYFRHRTAAKLWSFNTFSCLGVDCIERENYSLDLRASGLFCNFWEDFQRDNSCFASLDSWG